MSVANGLFRIPPKFLEKIWGSTNLAPWFAPPSNKIGEVWFTREPEPLPILVKFIFTSEKLSVQVHPDDAYASAKDNLPGKTEMWHILRAEPGATIAMGFRETITRERMREAALSGEIEHLLDWVPVRAGDTFFIRTGTVHAIGGGIALCEIQQMSDTTYRLYDYGRARPLHIERSLDVAIPGPYAGTPPPVALPDGWIELARCPYFATQTRRLDTPLDLVPDPAGLQILIVLGGHGAIAGEPLRLGEAWCLEPGARPCPLQPEGELRLLRTFVPR